MATRRQITSEFQLTPVVINWDFKARGFGNWRSSGGACRHPLSLASPTFSHTHRATLREWGQQLYIKVHPDGVKESVSRAFERHKRIYEMAHEKRFYESFPCSSAHRKYLFNLLPPFGAAWVQRGWLGWTTLVNLGQKAAQIKLFVYQKTLC
jgi:hypothetical protein